MTTPTPTPDLTRARTLFGLLAKAVELRNGDAVVLILSLLQDEIGRDAVNSLMQQLIDIGLHRIAQQRTPNSSGGV
ncbi:hypothetical protein Dvina_45065 [Dactylosporangium vinaceum]|uniref:Uncharacterized protein n=1 Tax=Dactylosporangium vinaceum TaxID=53362 RepID=A0ABV5MIK3_9ACTN|nr:hypothetical protein [Dactylosporangium vinaceum]UAB95147.1 hypothetical protein Dvina_45065 [Dactylosporangium vinaceum]